MRRNLCLWSNRSSFVITIYLPDCRYWRPFWCYPLECALVCIANAPLGGCASTDNKCLCENPIFIDNVQSCIQSTCTGEDLTTAENFITETCDAVGVTSLPTATPTTNWTVPLSSAHIARTGRYHDIDLVGFYSVWRSVTSSVQILPPITTLSMCRGTDHCSGRFAVNLNPNEVFRVLFD